MSTAREKTIPSDPPLHAGPPSPANRDSLESNNSPPPFDLAPSETREGGVRVATIYQAGAGAAVLLAFWVSACWLYGSLFKVAEGAHNLTIDVVDFDGGVIGAALLGAAKALKGIPTYPIFRVLNGSTTTPAEVLHRVFSGQSWGAMYATAGATTRFEEALASPEAAASYNASAAWTYSGLEVRYPVAWGFLVVPAFDALEVAGAEVFAKEVAGPLILSGNITTAGAVSVLLNPIGASYVDLTQWTFGARIMINTAGMVFPIVMPFLFLMALNVVWSVFGLYRNTSLGTLLKSRFPLQVVWTLIVGLSTAGWILTFGEGYKVSAANFFALWTVLWVYAMINFDILDAFTAFLPLPVLAPCMICYVFTSLSCNIYPLEVQSRFFRFSWAWPAHSVWLTMITILGHGAANELKKTLPILMAWLIVAKLWSTWGNWKRAKESGGLK